MQTPCRKRAVNTSSVDTGVRVHGPFTVEVFDTREHGPRTQVISSHGELVMCDDRLEKLKDIIKEKNVNKM